ncbi:MAG: AlpA family phage regulatory protein [Pseudomonadota bacterium]
MKSTLLSIDAVRTRTSLSRSAIYRALVAGHFPRPVKINSHRNAWVEAEIDQWIASQIASRDLGGSNGKASV